MEHLSTFGLSRDPFANEPRIDGFFASPVHLDAERRLARAVRQNKGLVLLLGEPGSGKSLIVRRLLESLEEEMFEACMLVPIPGVSDGQWVIDRLCRQLGEESPAGDLPALLGQLYDHLATVREEGRHTVVLLDESQVLHDAGVLASLRGLLNLEYEERRLLTLVLTGPLELGAAVANEPALSSRVEARVQIQPMDGPSAEDYLRHRIRAAEGNPAILESSAIDALVKRGAGIPRKLNDLADGALFEAHLAGRVAATGEDVARAASELEPAAADDVGSLDAVIQPVRSDQRIRDALASADSSAGSGVPELLTPAEDLFERLPQEAPPASRGAADQTMILAAPGEDDALDELTSLLAESPRAAAPSLGSGTPDATVALIEEVPPTAQPAAAAAVPPASNGQANAAETVALFVDPGDGEEGELDNLFADLVSED